MKQHMKPEKYFEKNTLTTINDYYNNDNYSIMGDY